MSRTIIDLLKTGNQELFHSSMIAWLLDHEAEHELGDRFRRGALHAVSQPSAEFESFVRKLDEDGVEVRVETEVSNRRGGRYDILVTASGSSGTCRLVIENKTKSLGSHSQLDNYMKDEAVDAVLALAWCEHSFDVRPKHPFLTYADVARCLCEVDDDEAPKRSFGHLLLDYRRFLDRELELLSLIDRGFAAEDSRARETLRTRLGTSRNGNELRFLNLFLLRTFVCSERLPVPRAEWRTEKNSSSGAWGLMPRSNDDSVFVVYPSLTEQCPPGGHLWFQLSLWDRALYGAGDEVVGQIKLGTGARPEVKNRHFRDAVKAWAEKHVEGVSVLRLMARPRSDAKSFGIFKRPIRASELPFQQLASVVRDFAQHFGTFR